ncbi:phage tail protein [Proteus appendicitidis]|uniref:Phage tail protein n=1 Tax=Proteus appendicitidis TaxID=3034648 RepID=A0ABY8Y7Z1_9GAMM|nr:phage tail protein [Proteus sp. HZ0627]WIV88533.1 phage tail protein [Proteus sp. HZ0627]
MSAKFFALLTVIGANKLAKATALGTTLKITQMAVGDGGGTLPTPDTQQTKLVGEKRRAGLNTLFVDPKNDSQIIAEQVIPENEGGYWIREIGLFDDEGSLIAVGNCPETYKPQLQEGSGRTQTIRMILTVSHTESVELKVDPSVILATRESVNDAIETASKSILDTVKKEYATKEDVKKKFDNSNVVHEVGASKEKVISQKGVTDLFQPKGTYPTASEMNVELNKKVDKASVSQQLGNDVNKVPSLDLVTKELGKKQASGNYADKLSTQTQVFNGATSATGSSSVTFRGNSVDLIVSNTVVLFKTKIGDANNEIALPNNSGTLALAGESYTKSQSDGRYQPTGNYALAGTSYTKIESDAKYQLKGNYSLIGDSYTKNESDSKYQQKGNYADKSSTQTQVFNSATSATGSSSVTFRGNSVDLIVSNTVVLFKTKIGDANNEIALPNNSGTLALAGESYTKSQSDGRYQPIGDYALKSELNDIELVPHPIPWSLSTAPTGYLICQGQTFNKTTYPKLATAYPSGKLPDLRGEFIRGSDADRGVDSGRVVLSTQPGNSLLSTNMLNNDSPVAKEYQQKVEWIGSSGTNNQGGYGIFQQIEGANGNETRPRNIAFLYIVRAA